MRRDSYVYDSFGTFLKTLHGAKKVEEVADELYHAADDVLYWFTQGGEVDVDERSSALQRLSCAVSGYEELPRSSKQEEKEG